MEQIENDGDQAKQTLDYIFVINLICIDRVNKIGAAEIDISQMHIMGAWGQLYMNLAWLQRIYNKGSLPDSGQVDVDMKLTGDRALDLKSVVSSLNTILEKIEHTNFRPLWEGAHPGVPFEMMIDRVYAGAFEALSYLEREIDILEKSKTETDIDKNDP